MPLQQLVEYFNDRLEHEHNSGFRPFVLENHQVEGLFGPIRISSKLAPIRKTLSTSHVLGHTAQLVVSANQAVQSTPHHIDSVLAVPPEHTPNSETVVNFDRLSRTVHMLNYLPQAHLDELLFLDVDPRHILGVKEDHGAYFEEVIVSCGLQTGNIAIAMPVDNAYARFYPSLLKGLNNYQKRGYRLALKFEYHGLDKPTMELISRAAPDYVGLNAQNLERIRDNKLPDKLQQLNGLVSSINGETILLHVEDKHTAALARQTGFDWVEGYYYEQAESLVSQASGLRPKQLNTVDAVFN